MKRNQFTALLRHVGSSIRLSLALCVTGIFTSASFAASTSKDTYYVNDHLATTVATSDAAGEIAQIESDAFGTQAGAVAKDSRFTGKPYDADMGAYVFPFRNYRSDEARWMSADPSGFPDGVNSQRYLYNPLAECDPMGLTSTSVYVSGTTENATSGVLTMNIDTTPHQVGSDIRGVTTVIWGITGSLSGWIVQHIVVTKNTETIHDFYEAWQVNSGSIPSGYDIFDTGVQSGSWGTWIANGSGAKFYTNTEVGDTAPSTWGQSDHDSGSLPSTTAAPSWFTGTGISHTLRLTWE